jgi:hypothetical protein
MGPLRSHVCLCDEFLLEFVSAMWLLVIVEENCADFRSRY